MRAKRNQKLWRVLSPEEWLKRYSDWRKCQPGSPKRQAYEIIKRQARKEKGGGSWVDRI